MCWFKTRPELYERTLQEIIILDDLGIILDKSKEKHK